MNQTNRKGGFSLLELLVVLVIIAVSAALIGPRLAGSLATANLKTAAKRVAAALRYARSQAAAEKIPFSALLDLESGRVTVSSRDASPPETGATEEPPEEGREKGARTYQLPADVRIEKASAGEVETATATLEILFYPVGGSSGGELVLVNERERRYRISVDFVTATVTLAVVGKN